MSAGAAEPVERALRRLLGSDGFLDVLPVAICCLDRDGVIHRYNRRAVALWGRAPRSGETGDGLHPFQAPSDLDGRALPPDEVPVARVLRTGEALHDQLVRVERADGARLTVLANVEPLRDESGALVGAVSCFQDVTETGETLRRSRHDLGLFENDAVALLALDAAGAVRRANAAARRLLGRAEAALVGHPFAALHDDPAAADDMLSRLRRGARLDKVIARLRAADGSLRHVQITSVPGTGLEGTRCFLVDVTDETRAEERARDAARRFRDALEALPVAVYTTDEEGRVTYFNTAVVELSGREPEIGSDAWCRGWRMRRADGAPLPYAESAMALALAQRRPIVGEETVAERPDGSAVRFVPYPTPLYDGEGRMTGAVVLLLDITERHRAEVESAHLAAIVSSSDDAIVSKSLDGIVRSWNDGATRIFGYTPDEMIGQSIMRIIPPELQGEEVQILARLQRGERIDHFETERLTRDGDRIDISLTVSPMHDRAGRIVGASKVARDISERKKAEELQRLLVGELNHRVKNTLATVQSMAGQTARFTRDPAAFATRFSGRIRALAQAHDLLTQNAWTGTEVMAVARAQLMLDGVEEERVSCSGPAVLLEPQPALHLGLMLHELGTNARKHGALSVPEGRLSVHWAVEDGATLVLRWRESGGPAVTPPAARGFGTTLIERCLATHGGTARLAYHPEGLTCDVTLPLPVDRRSPRDTLAALLTIRPAAPAPPPSMPETTTDELRGKRVLVVEDEPLIGMEMVETLAGAGCVTLGPATTLADAREIIESAELDAALLDANLGGDPVDDLAAALDGRDVPFAFLTGYGRETLPRAFADALLINKPFTRRTTLDIVGRLTRREPRLEPAGE